MAHDLARLDADRALLLAGISHDLRTPLSRLRLGVEMLDDRPTRRCSDGMVQDIEDMDAVIGQFLDFARVPRARRPCPTATSTRSCAKCASATRAPAMRCATRLEELPPLRLRPLAMQRLIANLVDNALRHGNGQAEVSTVDQGGMAVLEVLDRGPGIPPGEAERMLQPFTRLNAARSDAGTGLGLAIVDRIARLQGGRVQLLPRDGGGLRVRVELPLKT